MEVPINYLSINFVGCERFNNEFCEIYTQKNIKRELNSIVRIKKVLIFMKLFPKDLTAVKCCWF